MKAKEIELNPFFGLGMNFCPPAPFQWKGEMNWLLYLLDPSGLTGLEPAASALTGRCSDQLNYNPSEIRDLAEIFILISESSIYER